MSPTDIKHFLVVHDGSSGGAVVEQFGTDYEAAVAAYAEREEQYRDDPSVDIVLLGADSIATIKKTHSSYFETAGHGFERFLPR